MELADDEACPCGFALQVTAVPEHATLARALGFADVRHRRAAMPVIDSCRA